MPRCFKKSLSSLLPHIGHTLFPSSVFVATPKSKDALKGQSANISIDSSANTEVIDPVPSTSFHQISIDSAADVADVGHSHYSPMEEHDESDIEAGYATINEKPNPISNHDKQSTKSFKTKDQVGSSHDIKINDLYAKPREKSLRKVKVANSEDDDSKSEENAEIFQVDDNSDHQLSATDQLEKNLNALHILQTISNDVSEKQDKQEKAFKKVSQNVLLTARSEPSIMLITTNNRQLNSKYNDADDFLKYYGLIKQQVERLQKELIAWEKFRTDHLDLDLGFLHQLSVAFKELYENQKQYITYLEHKRLDLEKQEPLITTIDENLNGLNQTNNQDEKHQFSNISEVLEETDIIRQQLEDLLEEKRIFKDTIHRLNTELSRYQSEFRRLDPEELPKINSFLSENDPVPPWLINIKYLSPLFLAYDDQMQQKEDIIITYEKELRNFQLRVEELINENDSLHQKVKKCTCETAVDKVEWKHLLEQAQLVIAENDILMQEIDISYSKMKEMHDSHVLHVSKLGQHLEEIKNDKVSLERTDQQLKNSYIDLKEKSNQMKSLLKNSISIEEYNKEKNAYKRLIAELHSEFKKESEISSSKMKLLQLEQKKLATQVSDLQIEKCNLQDKVKTLSKGYRYSQQKEISLEGQLQNAAEEAALTQKYLSKVLQMVDQISAERHIYVKLAKEQHEEALQMMEKIVEGTLTRKKLEDKLKNFKIRTNTKLSKATIRLKEQNDHLYKQRAEYEEEIGHLQYLLKIKQEKVTSLLSEKRQIEENLEIIWKLATNENQQIQKQLEESLNKSGKEINHS